MRLSLRLEEEKGSSFSSSKFSKNIFPGSI